jgi:hypothetical protein
MADEVEAQGEAFAPFLSAIADYKAVFGEGNVKPVSFNGLGTVFFQLGASLLQLLRLVTASAAEALAQQSSCAYTPAREHKEKTQKARSRSVYRDHNNVHLVDLTHTHTHSMAGQRQHWLLPEDLEA